MPDTFTNRVLNAQNLPSLPAVALEILAVTRDENASVERISQVLQNDPALTVRLLKVVNSSMFGIGRNVTSVRQAVVMMGLRAVKVMALGFSLTDSLRSGDADALDYQAFWRRSLTTATAARQLGRLVTPALADEAFVSGLLCDLGMLAALRCAREVYAPVLEEARRTGEPIIAVERRRLGVDHASLGRDLLAHWALPPSLCQAVGAHHDASPHPFDAPLRSLCATVMAAARIAEVFSDQTHARCLGEVEADCREWTGLQGCDLEVLLGELNVRVQETAALLNLDVGATHTYAQLQVEAAQQLASLSLEAELDRAASDRRAEDARRDAERLEREKAAILELAITDSLTGLANRAALDRRLEEEFHHARLEGSGVGLILLDIDHFKVFNDSHGHLAGDAMLRSVASCIKAAVGTEGLVARYGGEEFAVVVSRRSPGFLEHLAEVMRERVANIALRHEGRDLRATASFGVAVIDGVDLAAGASLLLRLADEAMYRAKRSGRNRVEGVLAAVRS